MICEGLLAGSIYEFGSLNLNCQERLLHEANPSLNIHVVLLDLQLPMQILSGHYCVPQLLHNVLDVGNFQ